MEWGAAVDEGVVVMVEEVAVDVVGGDAGDTGEEDVVAEATETVEEDIEEHHQDQITRTEEVEVEVAVDIMAMTDGKL